MKKYIYIVLFLLATILSLLGTDFKPNFSVILNICMADCGAIYFYRKAKKDENKK